MPKEKLEGCRSKGKLASGASLQVSTAGPLHFDSRTKTYRLKSNTSKWVLECGKLKSDVSLDALLCKLKRTCMSQGQYFIACPSDVECRPFPNSLVHVQTATIVFSADQGFLNPSKNRLLSKRIPNVSFFSRDAALRSSLNYCHPGPNVSFACWC